MESITHLPNTVSCNLSTSLTIFHVASGVRTLSETVARTEAGSKSPGMGLRRVSESVLTPDANHKKNINSPWNGKPRPTSLSSIHIHTTPQFSLCLNHESGIKFGSSASPDGGLRNEFSN